MHKADNILSKPAFSSLDWPAACRLPLAQIDPSHLGAPGLESEPISVIHRMLWANSTQLTAGEFERQPLAVPLLNMSRAVLVERLNGLGSLLLSPSLSKIIDGAQWRRIRAQFGPNLRMTPSNEADDVIFGAIQSHDSIQWESVLHLGTHASLAVGANWLRAHFFPQSAGLWSLLRLRLPHAVLVAIGHDIGTQPGSCALGADPHLQLQWFLSTDTLLESPSVLEAS